VRFLANENFPRLAVEALQTQGHDVLWMRTASPGELDSSVLARAQAEQRILLTFDKDFGELAFRRGLPAVCGIVLFRISLPAPKGAAAKIAAAIESRADWQGQFAVVEDDRVRFRPLPAGEQK